jgi:hypothetical protein
MCKDADDWGCGLADEGGLLLHATTARHCKGRGSKALDRKQGLSKAFHIVLRLLE